MQNARALKQLGAAVLAGACLFLDGCAVPATRAEMAVVPDQHAAAAADVVLEAVLPPTTVVAAPPAVAPAPAPAVAPAPFVFPTRPEQWFQPSGRNQGTEGLARFLAAVALRDNSPLYISEQWGRTTGSEQSDHHISRTDSWAADLAVRGIQVPTPTTELAARRVAAALGVPDWAGGDLTTTINGYRFQILWKVEGHFNHVHVGVRKV
jgi:hypothetical protein